jgi:hypothetical protein
VREPERLAEIVCEEGQGYLIRARESGSEIDGRARARLWKAENVKDCGGEKGRSKKDVKRWYGYFNNHINQKEIPPPWS